MIEKLPRVNCRPRLLIFSTIALFVAWFIIKGIYIYSINVSTKKRIDWQIILRYQRISVASDNRSYVWNLYMRDKAAYIAYHLSLTGVIRALRAFPPCGECFLGCRR